MTKKIILQKNLLISGIMCHGGCGGTLSSVLEDVFEEFKKQNYFPKDAELCKYAQPDTFGIHTLEIKIKSEETIQPQKNLESAFIDAFEKRLVEAEGPQIIRNLKSLQQNETSGKTNWINILVNLIAMGAIVALWFIFPPSLLLTIGLTTLSFLVTAFTARDYLINFFRNIWNKNLFNMTSTISLGWFLSLAHTIYHSISMPLVHSFSMAFMSFIMPVMLITIINGMDEIKRVILNKSKKMRLQGMKSLFPQMEDRYYCYQLSPLDRAKLAEFIEGQLENTIPEQFFGELFNNKKIIQESTSELKEGMCIQVNRGECFPVDCILIRGSTIVDASILTGESQLDKGALDFIPAGAINLGQSVIVYAKQDAYNSTVNQLLFRANRARENTAPKASSKFTYLYGALIIAGIAAAILAPAALGIFTVPLFLQNVIGLLFGICPCTIAIAHQLPILLSIYYRGIKGILLRDETVSNRFDRIHTVVFDKTGTLTTGNSSVISSEDISQGLWERVYLMEKKLGGAHPIAKAIVNYWKNQPHSLFDDVKNEKLDVKNRGLSATVQGTKIHIGNAEYLTQEGIILPNIDNIPPGVTPIYVAENNKYEGVIFIRHEPRKNIQKILERLKEQNVKIIMLTGDNRSSALGFNQQIGSIFQEEDIYATQTPQDKENFLSQLMDKSKNPEGIWFIGDGLNDGPCARIVSEKKGVSCAVNDTDKAAFFTDISLNGSLDYLFKHNKLNLFLKKNISQNQWILAYSSVAFLAFIISFSIAGIAVSPLIPLTIMLATTFFVLFNAYRIQLSIDVALDKTTSWSKRLLASDLSIGLLVVASSLLICAVLIATIATGGLAIPFIVFTAGTALAVSSSFVLAATALFAVFSLLMTSHFIMDRFITNSKREEVDLIPQLLKDSEPPTKMPSEDPTVRSDFAITRICSPRSSNEGEIQGQNFDTGMKSSSSI